MQRITRKLVLFFLFCQSFYVAPAYSQVESNSTKSVAPEKAPLVVDTFTFLAKSNLPGMKVPGKANLTTKAIKTFVQFSKSESDPALFFPKGVEFSIPVETLTTDMDLRDQHMRDRIFRTQDGALPPIEFTSESVQCRPPSGNEKPSKLDCSAIGNLKIQGKVKPTQFSFEWKNQGTLLTLEGTTQIKLSDFEIPAPQHLGVKIKDEIEISAKAHAEIKK